MANLRESRTNHYETLGLRPEASDREIGEAFKRNISLFGAHPLGAAAKVCIAYETLRDPLKRREHDHSLGLQSEKPAAASVPVAPPRWAPFIASPRFNPAGSSGTTIAAGSAPRATAAPEADAPVHPKVAAISASLQELGRPVGSDALPGSRLPAPETPTRDPQPRESGPVRADASVFPNPRAAPDPPSRPARRAGQKRASEQNPDLDLQQLVRQMRDPVRGEKASSRHAEHHAFAWKRPAIVVGSLILGAALFGALAGLSVKEGEAPTVADSAVSVPVPAAKHHPRLAMTSAPPVAGATETQAQFREPAPEPSSRIERTVSRPRRSAVPDRPVSATPPTTSDAVQGTVDQPPTELAEAVPAKLPLPANVIARTIERIGYSCGQVASSAALGPERRGVFRITCTSGQSYDAAPLRGRYHFRRVSSH